MGDAKPVAMKIGILSSHPIQYQAPLFRELAQRRIEFEALFCHDHGVKASVRSGFGRIVQFDVPLLDGYAHRFLKNHAPTPSLEFAGTINTES